VKINAACTVNFDATDRTVADDALVQGLEQNQDFFSMLLNNPEIKKQVLGVFVTEVYKTLKNK